jgi:hypothetical protein
MSNDRVLPQLDVFEKTRWSAEVELQRDSNAANQFLAEHPQYFNSDANSAAMLGWLKFQQVPVTVKNLTVAFRVLSADGKLETRSVQRVDIEPEAVDNTRGINKMDVKDTTILRYRVEDTPLNRKLVERDYAARQALCRIGDNPKKTALGTMHRKSLQDEHESRDDAAYLEARQKVIIQNPRLRKDSIEMNRKITEILNA